MKHEFKQAVILCGGEGSRLGKITKKIPKPLIKVNGKPFLEYQINYLKKFGFKKFLLLCGYQGKKFISKYKRNKDIKVIVEREKFDTGGALLNSIKKLEDKFLLYNGDTFADFNFNHFIEELKYSKYKNSIAIKYENLPNRYGKVMTSFRSKRVKKISKNINTKYAYSGFCLLNKSSIKKINFSKTNFEKLILENLIKKKNLQSFKINNKVNFVDIGVQKDLKKSLKILKNSSNRKIVFFDRDGTINKDIHYLIRPKDFIWNKSFFKTIRYLNSKNILVFIVTNQSGIGRGYYSQTDVNKLHEWMNKELIKKNSYIDDFFYAPYYNKSTKYKFNFSDLKKRKPNPGMIIEAKKKWDLNLKKSIIIGDSEVDELLAKKLNIKFYKVNFNSNLLKIVKPKL